MTYNLWCALLFCESNQGNIYFHEFLKLNDFLYKEEKKRKCCRVNSGQRVACFEADKEIDGISR